jgi:chemotaxis protein methyltransferase CheR
MTKELTDDFEIELKSLLEAINLKYCFDFRHYSPASMKRTIVQAMDRMACSTLAALHEKVLGDSGYFDDLLQCLTIPVREMFRDPAYCCALREKVFPLLKTYPSLKIWIAGCSAGEEVYSLAMLLQEEELLERTILYATDINPRGLEKAESGVFDLNTIQSFDKNYKASGGKRLLTDYYTVTANLAKFNSVLRRNITFASHSLVTDAVFSETHLISCRNVLIYFDRVLQDRAIGPFRVSLCRKGFLGFGATETIQFSKYSRDFDHFVKEDRIFQRNS